MKEPLFFKGGARHLRRGIIENLLVDFFDISSYKKLSLNSEKPAHDDLSFNSNETLWKHIISNRAYPDQYIKLTNFYITEWLPMSPGLYHTEEAVRMRDYATRFIVRDDYSQTTNRRTKLKKTRDLSEQSIKNRVAVELDPNGKMSMVQGGIGTLRLQPKKIFDNETVFLFGATSNGISHEGIPIILTSENYHKFIDQIKEDCGILCNLTGRLQVLPTDNVPIKYDRTIPKYTFVVEKISEVKRSAPKDIVVSIALTYAASLRDVKHKEWSFVSFNPDNKDSELLHCSEWLYDYAKRYSNVEKPIITSDFDEYREHFEKIDFHIKDVANGKIDLAKLAEYEDFLEFKIINIMGDHFSNISNSTIINKSKVENAFNKVKNSTDEETALALAQIAEFIQKSDNKDAGELFNAFNEELEKPEPKKSLLKTFWNGVTSTLPAITSIAGIVEKVIKIIG